MQRAPTFDELLAELPELAELENRVRAVRDPGGDLFCANNAWFSFARRLRELLGVWRRPSAGEDAARSDDRHHQRSVIQVAELHLQDGWLHVDRDAPPPDLRQAFGPGPRG